MTQSAWCRHGHAGNEHCWQGDQPANDCAQDHPMNTPSLPLSDEEIGELRDVLKGITKLPWYADAPGLYIFAHGTPQRGFRTMVADDGDGEHPNLTARMRGTGSGQPQERNLHAIATIMNAAPRLLAALSSERIARIEAEERLRNHVCAYTSTTYID